MGSIHTPNTCTVPAANLTRIIIICRIVLHHREQHSCWCNSCPSCVLEIVDRNRHGLICLLVHTERNSPCSTEDFDVPGEQFEELHRRLSLSKKMNELHRFNLLVEEEWSEGDDPSKVYCRRNAISSVFASEEIDCRDERRRRSEDVAFFSSFLFHSFES